MKTFRSMVMAALAAALLLLLSACGGSSGHGSRLETAAPQPARPTVSADPGAPVRGTKTLAQTWTYGDGVSVGLSAFSRGKSSSYGSPSDTPYVSFQVTVTNHSPQPVDLEWMTVNCAAGGRSAQRVFDDGLDLSETHLMTGKSYRIKAACSVPKSVHDIQVEVSPDFDHDSAVFTGTVA